MLIAESGRILATRREGSAYYFETGMDALQAMLASGIQATLQAAAVLPADVTFAVLGLPAYGEDSALIGRLDLMASTVLAAPQYRCVNDMVCGWAGALAGSDGISIVAGTGSIAYGEAAGRSARAGGWGELFSDEGSAYWVATQGLRMFTRMSDGRTRPSVLYDLLRAHFHLRSDLDLVAAVFGPPPLTRSQIAALAPLIARAANEGDISARGIFTAAGQELAEIVGAVRSQLAVPAHIPLPVSYSGGMFQEDETMLAALRTALRSSDVAYALTAPRLGPTAGAALYAARLSGAPLAPEALETLAQGSRTASGGVGE